MYELIKKSDNVYCVLKDGSDACYTVKRVGENFECDCKGFKYRGTCKHVDFVKEYESEVSKLSEKIPARDAREILNEVLPIIESKSDSVEVVGSLRRGCLGVKDIDLVVVPKNESVDSWYELIEALESSPFYERKVSGDSIVRGYYKGVLLDINRSNKSDLVPMKLYRTGSTQFNIKMRSVAKMKGYALNEHGLYDRLSGSLLSTSEWTEKDYFDALGMQYISADRR